VSFERPVYPFSAIVGQERMKTGLLLNAIDPRIGGVLIRGEKGTAKSTAVRGFARLMPEMTAVAGCPYACDPAGVDPCDDCRRRIATDKTIATVRRQVPVVELPVGATEDRVLGTLNLEHAIKEGERLFEPGLLAAANRGILYVDEVNLLGDHLVDVLLDAAAMGHNYVEREGVSISHPAQFILVGTMNPEEGELRPQLLDRFALAVDVEGFPDPAQRAEVVRRRIAFEVDPAAFVAEYSAAEEQERQRLAAAKELLPVVRLEEPLLELITQICAAAEVDGLRSDIIMYKAAVALAAYDGRRAVEPEDVKRAAELVLPHRQRRHPFDDPEGGRQRLDDLLRGQMEQSEPPADERDEPAPDTQSPDEPRFGGSEEQRVFAMGTPFAVRRLTTRERGTPERAAPGRRTTVTGRSKQGRPVGARQPPAPLKAAEDVALTASLRTAAPHQRARHAVRAGGPALLVEAADLRQKVREVKTGNLVVLAVDASGSMAARERMVAVKGAVLSLLLDAYQKRDRVAVVAFRGRRASLLLPPTNSVELAERRLRSLPTGGRTPLAHALQLCDETIARQLTSDPERIPWLVLISDGRPNVAIGAGSALDEARMAAAAIRERGVRSLVIDSEGGAVKLGYNRLIAEALGAELLRLEELRADSIAATVRARVSRQPSAVRKRTA
jgi:magnesium chelatase subunit D